MKIPQVNILVLDDIDVVGENILKRISKIGEKYCSINNVSINPVFIRFEKNSLAATIDKIEAEILKSNIQFLVIDRGIAEIFTSSDDATLNKDYLYTSIDNSSIQADLVLEKLSISIPEQLTALRGVIIYTYDGGEDIYKHMEPTEIIHLTREKLPKKFSGAVDVILTASEIYKLSNMSLYENERVQSTKYVKLGSKSSFKLYGLFVGEIIYHRIVHLYRANTQSIFKSKNATRIRNLILLYVIFTSINIGGNILSNILFSHNSSNFIGYLITFFAAVIFPVFILLLKPTWIFNIDE